MPKKVEISFKVMGKGEQKGQVLRQFAGAYNYGETAEESIKMFGPEPVNSGFIASDKITVQNRLRSACEKNPNLTDADLAKMLSEHKPGVAAVRVAADPIAAIKSKIAGLADPEAKKKLIADLIAQLKSA